MSGKYEYKIVRVGEGAQQIRRTALKEYEKVINENAEEGWRLVQVFAPGIGYKGSPKYFDVILEKKRK